MSASSLSISPPAAKFSVNKFAPLTVLPRRHSQVLRTRPNANNVSRRENSNFDVVMVDPSEAKRLAAKQMKEIQARNRFNRRRWIEAINGAWAMIGLTAGLVIEGRTGKGILAQLHDYLTAITSFPQQ